MTDAVLLERIKRLIATERRIGTAILDCLSEIDRRRIYSDLRYDGLFTFCVKELGFSDAQTYSRIQAMRALQEIPEIRAKIESGSLSVSSAAKVQTYFQKEKKEGKLITRSDKLQLFRAVENLTSRAVEEKIAQVRGVKLLPKLILEMDEELEALWAATLGLAAHRSKGEPAEVLKILTREWLEKNDPAKKSVRRAVPFPGKDAPPQKAPVDKRTPSAALRREVWKRDRGECTNCRSRFALEIDHIIPFANGGETTRGNLRLLCRSCNQAAAVRSFGYQKIEAEKNRASGIRTAQDSFDSAES
jgi:hypothetical protein